MVDIAEAREEAASVRKASDVETSAMAGALARAFFDDPVFTWVLRGDMRRMKVLRRGFELFLRRVWLEEQQTFTTTSAAGVAVWEPPGKWKHPLAQQLPLLPSMIAVFGRHSPRVLKALTVLESDHPAEPAFSEHYYLAFLGVDPPWQGRGLGSALLAPVLGRCDAEHVPAYLEASTPRNRDLYERHGFQVTEEFALGRGAPPQWRMWRGPGKESTARPNAGFA
jgi:ribosomal protein S18 acetylase RimI-like enzyme